MILNLGKGKIKDKQCIHELIENLFVLVDNLQAYTPSQKTLEKFRRNRIKINQKKRKEEIDEQQPGILEEKMKNMTPAEREKFKQRKMKRMQNKMQRKMKAISKM